MRAHHGQSPAAPELCDVTIRTWAVKEVTFSGLTAKSGAGQSVTRASSCHQAVVTRLGAVTPQPPVSPRSRGAFPRPGGRRQWGDDVTPTAALGSHNNVQINTVRTNKTTRISTGCYVICIVAIVLLFVS